MRELNGITFPGAPYEHVFFVADMEATGSMVPDEVNVYLWREGFHLLFPMRGKDHWRIVGILPPALRDRKDVTFEAVMPSLRNEAGAGLSFKTCTWFSTYRIHHRSASRFRDRRCFLLGDAAHIHSPVGAQGMNTGLQDAYNLAWKLALVVKGQADAALLDSYEEERIPVAQRLLNTTDRAFRLVVSDSWLAGLLRTKVLARIAAFAMSLERVQRIAFRTVSQTGIDYRKSPLSKSLEGLPDDCAARRRSLPVAAAQAPGGRRRRGSVPETRRYAIQPDRDRAACPSKERSTSAICVASTRFLPIRSMTRNWRAHRFPSPRSISCVLTAISDFAALAWKPPHSNVSSPSGCA